jgi:hypothetical protein
MVIGSRTLGFWSHNADSTFQWRCLYLCDRNSRLVSEFMRKTN